MLGIEWALVMYQCLIFLVGLKIEKHLKGHTDTRLFSMSKQQNRK